MRIFTIDKHSTETNVFFKTPDNVVRELKFIMDRKSVGRRLFQTVLGGRKADAHDDCILNSLAGTDHKYDLFLIFLLGMHWGGSNLLDKFDLWEALLLRYHAFVRTCYLKAKDCNLELTLDEASELVNMASIDSLRLPTLSMELYTDFIKSYINEATETLDFAGGSNDDIDLKLAGSLKEMWFTCIKPIEREISLDSLFAVVNPDMWSTLIHEKIYRKNEDSNDNDVQRIKDTMSQPIFIMPGKIIDEFEHNPNAVTSPVHSTASTLHHRHPLGTLPRGGAIDDTLGAPHLRITSAWDVAHSEGTTLPPLGHPYNAFSFGTEGSFSVGVDQTQRASLSEALCAASRPLAVAQPYQSHPVGLATAGATLPFIADPKSVNLPRRVPQVDAWQVMKSVPSATEPASDDVILDNETLKWTVMENNNNRVSFPKMTLFQSSAPVLNASANMYRSSPNLNSSGRRGVVEKTSFNRSASMNNLVQENNHPVVLFWGHLAVLKNWRTNLTHSLEAARTISSAMDDCNIALQFLYNAIGTYDSTANGSSQMSNYKKVPTALDEQRRSEAASGLNKLSGLQCALFANPLIISNLFAEAVSMLSGITTLLERYIQSSSCEENSEKLKNKRFLIDNAYSLFDLVTAYEVLCDLISKLFSFQGNILMSIFKCYGHSRSLTSHTLGWTLGVLTTLTDDKLIPPKWRDKTTSTTNHIGKSNQRGSNISNRQQSSSKLSDIDNIESPIPSKEAPNSSSYVDVNLRDLNGKLRWPLLSVTDKDIFDDASSSFGSKRTSEQSNLVGSVLHPTELKDNQAFWNPIPAITSSALGGVVPNWIHATLFSCLPFTKHLVSRTKFGCNSKEVTTVPHEYEGRALLEVVRRTAGLLRERKHHQTTIGEEMKEEDTTYEGSYSNFAGILNNEIRYFHNSHSAKRMLVALDLIVLEVTRCLDLLLQHRAMLTEGEVKNRNLKLISAYVYDDILIEQQKDFGQLTTMEIDDNDTINENSSPTSRQESEPELSAFISKFYADLNSTNNNTTSTIPFMNSFSSWAVIPQWDKNVPVEPRRSNRIKKNERKVEWPQHLKRIGKLMPPSLCHISNSNVVVSRKILPFELAKWNGSRSSIPFSWEGFAIQARAFIFMKLSSSFNDDNDEQIDMENQNKSNDIRETNDNLKEKYLLKNDGLKSMLSGDWWYSGICDLFLIWNSYFPQIYGTQAWGNPILLFTLGCTAVLSSNPTLLTDDMVLCKVIVTLSKILSSQPKSLISALQGKEERGDPAAQSLMKVVEKMIPVLVKAIIYTLKCAYSQWQHEKGSYHTKVREAHLNYARVKYLIDICKFESMQTPVLPNYEHPVGYDQFDENRVERRKYRIWKKERSQRRKLRAQKKHEESDMLIEDSYSESVSYEDDADIQDIDDDETEINNSTPKTNSQTPYQSNEQDENNRTSRVPTPTTSKDNQEQFEQDMSENLALSERLISHCHKDVPEPPTNDVIASGITHTALSLVVHLLRLGIKDIAFENQDILAVKEAAKWKTDTSALLGTLSTFL